MGVGVLDEVALAAGELGVEGAEEAEEAPAEAEEAPEEAGGTGDGFEPYAARVVAIPASIVDDYGKPLFVILAEGTPVEVRGEELPVRKRVWCERCDPQVEGWLQAGIVERAPGAE